MFHFQQCSPLFIGGKLQFFWFSSAMNFYFLWYIFLSGGGATQINHLILICSRISRDIIFLFDCNIFLKLNSLSLYPLYPYSHVSPSLYPYKYLGESEHTPVLLSLYSLYRLVSPESPVFSVSTVSPYIFSRCNKYSGRFHSL